MKNREFDVIYLVRTKRKNFKGKLKTEKRLIFFNIKRAKVYRGAKAFNSILSKVPSAKSLHLLAF